MKMNRIAVLLAFTALSASSVLAQDASQPLVTQGISEGTQSFDSSAQLNAQPTPPVMQPVEAQVQPVPAAVQPVSNVARKVIRQARNYVFPSSAPKSMSSTYKQDVSKPFNEKVGEYQPVDYRSSGNNPTSSATYISDTQVTTSGAASNIQQYRNNRSAGLGYVATPGKSENFEVVNPNVSATSTTNPIATKNADYRDGGSAPTQQVSGLTIFPSSGSKVIREDIRQPSLGEQKVEQPAAPDNYWRNPNQRPYDGQVGNGGASRDINPVSKGSFFFSSRSE